MVVLAAPIALSTQSYAETTRDYLAGLIRQYRESSCEQIVAEARTVALRASRPAQTQPTGRANARVETTVIRWPNLSSWDKVQSDKFKDQMLVIEEAAIEKQCNIQFEGQTR